MMRLREVFALLLLAVILGLMAYLAVASRGWAFILGVWIGLGLLAALCLGATVPPADEP